MSKSPAKLTDTEKQSPRNKAKAEPERLDSAFSNETTKQKIDDFKDTFSKCEIVYKVILEEHQFKKTGEHLERLQITMRQVPHALAFAGYDFDNLLLTKLFGSKEKIGKRSVKKLRDSLTHSLNQKAIDELIQREQELYAYMNDFLMKIRQFDQAA